VKCCDMYRGKLRHTVELQRKARTDDGLGGFDIEWSTYATAKAYVETKPGKEVVIGDRLEASQVIRATIRYRSDVDETDRVIYKGKAHNIRSVSNLEGRDKWLLLDMERGVAV